LGEYEIGGDDYAAPLIAFRQEGEEDFHLLTALLDVAEIIEDDHLEAVKTAQFAFEDVAEEAPQAAAAMADVAIAAREGQIAALLPNGRIAINLGASSGVTVGDRFEVLEVENLVVDPNTSEILDYEIIEVKGEIEVIEARERVSYAVTINDFAPIIGDVVRAVP
jgi:hypothetical protein